MGLTNNKEEQLKKMPLIETKVVKSKDGKYIIHRTVITSIKPVAYYNTILESDGSKEEETQAELAPEPLVA